MRYYPLIIRVLTLFRESGQGTLFGGQFDWGGFLLKSNGGVYKVG